MTKYPPYTPMSSLGRELGIMFAFIAACLVTMGIYTFVWRIVQQKNTAQDLDRRKAFHSRTAPAADTRLLGSPTTGGGGRNERIAEKMLDRYAIPEDRAELPVHGQMGERSSGSGSGWNGSGNGEGFGFGFGGASASGVQRRDLL
ncbi:hypothetical protein N7532_005143 [Penicillium argentinense]|uniref:Uncharacterized protein n=1 Tax=Penicillium argentinense TaxID=1131581 RepID=A0A9W9FDF1_9EURO|nr:uncharacterized protein N7532_005143 [Penicillium argentinense]KAJ5098142.1 hypothetical protein N7532_005143 [Penicillium argentinense]